MKSAILLGAVLKVPLLSDVQHELRLGSASLQQGMDMVNVLAVCLFDHLLRDPESTQLKHEVRESWRAIRWEAWRHGRRREVQLQDVGAYDTHRMSLVRKTFYTSTGSTRAVVMLGSVLSPAGPRQAKGREAS